MPHKTSLLILDELCKLLTTTGLPPAVVTMIFTQSSACMRLKDDLMKLLRSFGSTDASKFHVDMGDVSRIQWFLFVRRGI